MRDQIMHETSPDRLRKTMRPAMRQFKERNATRPAMTEWEGPADVIVCNADFEEPKQSARGSEACPEVPGSDHWNTLAGAYQSDEELWRWTGPWDM